MKTSFVNLVMVTLVALAGCTANSAKTPEATVTAAAEQSAEPVKTVVNKPIIGVADASFSLSVPSDSIALTQGEEQSVVIGINRGENFDEDVAIDVSSLPEGVTLTTADPVIKYRSTEATLIFKAAVDATLGDFTGKVTGHSSSSDVDFAQDLKMTVAKK